MESNRMREGVSLAADITGILAFLAIPATALLVWLRARLEYSWWVLALAIVVLIGPFVAYLFFKKLLPRLQRERSPWTTSHPKKLLLSASKLLDWLPKDWRKAVVKTYGPIEHLVGTRLMIVCEAEMTANKPVLKIEMADWSDEKMRFETKAKVTFTPEQLGKL